VGALTITPRAELAWRGRNADLSRPGNETPIVHRVIETHTSSVPPHTS
jgi:hypothetical protein